MSDDFRDRLNNPAIQRQKIAVELGTWQRTCQALIHAEAENERLSKQVEAAKALLDEIQNTIDKGHLWTDRTKVGYIADALERHRATQEQES